MISNIDENPNEHSKQLLRNYRNFMEKFYFFSTILNKFHWKRNKFKRKFSW